MVISIQELRKQEQQRQDAFNRYNRQEKPNRFPWQQQPEPEPQRPNVLKFARFLYDS